MNTLDENQVIDTISSKVSEVHNFEKNKITQALFNLTEGTKTIRDNVMQPLRQIATKIINNPYDPISARIIEKAKNSSTGSVFI